MKIKRIYIRIAGTNDTTNAEKGKVENGEKKGKGNL